MTRNPKWRQIQAKRKGSGTFVGIFTVLLLLGFLLFGLVKNFHIRSSSLSTESANAYLALLGTNPTSLFVFEKESRKATIFILDDQKPVVSTVGENKLVKIGDLKNQQNGLKFLNTMTLAFRTKISNYFILNKSKELSAQNLK